MPRIALFLRSFVFACVLAIATIIWALACVLFLPLPYEKRYYWTSRWNVFIVWTARIICGIRYQVKGYENLPDSPVVLLSKHQSAWETIFYLYTMPRPLVYVYKKEVNYIPFFGWALSQLHMIPIDRSKGRDAFDQILKIGKTRLAEGKWIILFPEGTRALPGERGRYKSGGARFAVETGTVVVPIAMNAGECWSKNSFIRKPGLITVSIGKPISPQGLTHIELMQQVENWIESEMRVISQYTYPS